MQLPDPNLRGIEGDSSQRVLEAHDYLVHRRGSGHEFYFFRALSFIII